MSETLAKTPETLENHCKHSDETKDENGTEIFRTDRFRFLYYDTVF
jgi:hypothetical protein